VHQKKKVVANEIVGSGGVKLLFLGTLSELIVK
jgi:hypothetical protein